MILKTIHWPIFLLILITSCQGPQKSPEQLKKEREVERINAEKEKLRIDSLTFYTLNANEQLALKKYEIENLYIDSALIYALGEEKSELNLKRAQALYELRKYDESIILNNDLISSNYKTKETYYLRGLCYLKERKIPESVNDLKEAIELGNSDAEAVHEKVNPIKKRVGYYVTRCCDGTTSDATGRGACSHHGGVCNWNEPVYEEYRKY